MPIDATRQPGEHEPRQYEPPALLSAGDDIDALLAVRLDPTQEEPEDDE
jgi:hypothetical protein